MSKATRIDQMKPRNPAAASALSQTYGSATARQRRVLLSALRCPTFGTDGYPGEGKNEPTAKFDFERPNFLTDHASFLRCPDYH